jgi:predicted porin
MTHKIFFFLLTLLLWSKAFGENEDAYEEDKLLNEKISEKLLENGIDCPFVFNGDIDCTCLFVKQKERADFNNTVASLRGNVNLAYLGRADNYGYGFEIGCKINSGIIKQGDATVQTSFIFFEEDRYGILRLGYTNTAADLFSIGGDKFLVGYGGAGSRNLWAFYNQSAGTITSAGFPYDDIKAAKILWLSPTISGFSTGISFTFDSRNASIFKTKRNKLKEVNKKTDFYRNFPVFSKNIVTAGIAYEYGMPDEFNAKIAFAIWLGKGKSQLENGFEVNNLRAYNIGITLGYEKFNFSIGYTDNGKSLLSKKYVDADIAVFDSSRNYNLTDPEVGIKEGATAGKAYSLGLSYSLSPFVFSCGYFKSIVKFSKDENVNANIFSLAAQYTLNKSFSFYVECDNVSTDTCARAQSYSKANFLSYQGKNHANLFMIGSKINF